MWKREKVYFNTSEYFAAVIRRIDAAVDSVDMEMYIFKRDRLGKSLLAALERAANRKVTVRLIIDGLGSPAWSIQDLKRLAKKKVFVRVYHPLPWPFSRMFWHHPGAAIKLLLNINRRNHKKLIIVDGETAFIGSMNVSTEHMGWRETSVLVQGDHIIDLEKSFEITWSHSYNPGLPRIKRLRKRKFMKGSGKGLVRTNITRRLRRRHNRELLARILLAKQRVWLTSAYFIPSPKIVRHLVLAAQSGADVRLLLPRYSDVKIVRWVSMLFYFSLLRAGITIYEYLPAMLHAKTVLVDEWASIGTSNLNHRSLYHDLEVDVVLKKGVSVARLSRQFERDLENSDRVTEQWLERRPVLTRAAGYLGSLMRWWM